MRRMNEEEEQQAQEQQSVIVFPDQQQQSESRTTTRTTAAWSTSPTLSLSPRAIDQTSTTATEETTTIDNPPPASLQPQHIISDDEYQHWMSIVKEDDWHNVTKLLPDAPVYIRNDKKIFMAAVKRTGYALRYASPEIQNYKKVVMAAVQQYGHALEFVSPSLQNDKQVVLAAVRSVGFALKYAPPKFQNDKKVVMAAVKQNPDAIKYVHSDDLKRDRDVLIAASMFDSEHQDALARRKQQQRRNVTTRKIVFSTRFSLNEDSWSQATNFTALFKRSKYIQQEGNHFTIYAPNAFDKRTCDPEWTNFDWPCRGTNRTCKYKNKLTPEGHPTDDCCWRYSFRSQLQEAKDAGGFMLQLVETGNHGTVFYATLGNGQMIELDMANSMGVEIFQVYCPELNGYEMDFSDRHIDAVSNEISRWYNGQCQDMSVTIIRPRWDDG